MVLVQFVLDFFAPYVYAVLIGLILGWMILRVYSPRNFFLKCVVVLMVVSLPFGLYFSLNPIFQNDLNTSSHVVKVDCLESNLVGDGLLMIGIPGCPYCKEALIRLLEVKEECPELHVKMFIIGTDTNNEYQKLANRKIEVLYGSGSELREGLQLKKYPTFALVRNGVIQKYWTNDQFGVFALNEACEALKVCEN